MSRTSLAFVAILLASPVPAAFAQTRDLGSYQQALQANCANDYLRLCAGIDPNGKEVEACFKRNMTQVSAECRAAIVGFQGGAKAR